MRILVLCLPLLSVSVVYAVEKVAVLALFPGKAMLSIDGRNQLLSKGESSPDGVTLVSASPREAVVEFNGERRTLQLGSAVNASYQAVRQRETRITRDSQGYYMTRGNINGRAVDFLVDTGAGMIAMSEKEAKRLNIPYRLTGTPARVTTASGAAEAYSINLKSVTVGAIELNNVESVVIKGDYPPRVLLGMSFLGRLQIQNQGNLMILRKEH